DDPEAGRDDGYVDHEHELSPENARAGDDREEADGAGVIGEIAHDCGAVAHHACQVQRPQRDVEDDVQGEQCESDRWETEQMTGGGDDTRRHDQGEVRRVERLEAGGYGRRREDRGLRRGRGHWLCETPWVGNVSRYFTRLASCALVRVPSYPGIGVPGMPRRIAWPTCSGVCPDQNSRAAKLAGGGCIRRPAGPSPRPISPWQKAQRT